MAILIAVRPPGRSSARKRTPSKSWLGRAMAITARSVPRDILSTNPLMIYRRKNERPTAVICISRIRLLRRGAAPAKRVT